MGSNSKPDEGIWNDKYVTKLACSNGKQGLHCGWCDKVVSTLTRVVSHLLKIKGGNIAICKAIITEDHLQRYKMIRENSMSMSNVRAKAKVDVSKFIDIRQEDATDMFMASQVRSTKHSQKSSTLHSFLKSPPARADKRKQSHGIQTTIDVAL